MSLTEIYIDWVENAGSLGLDSLSAQSYKISWSLEAERLDVIMIVSLWNLTSCLSNFRAVGISRFQDFARSYGKTSVCLVNRVRGVHICLSSPIKYIQRFLCFVVIILYICNDCLNKFQPLMGYVNGGCVQSGLLPTPRIPKTCVKWAPFLRIWAVFHKHLYTFINTFGPDRLCFQGSGHG